MTFNIYVRYQPFARSMQRSIDRETMKDMLAIIEYEAERVKHLEEAGFEDQASSDEVLFSYVLDALGVPPDDEDNGRMAYDELFFSEYLLERRYKDLDSVLRAIEALRDDRPILEDMLG